MANMDHCRFENTFNDLQDCYEVLAAKNLNELSESEKEYAIRLIKLCQDFSDDFIDDATNETA